MLIIFYFVFIPIFDIRQFKDESQEEIQWKRTEQNIIRSHSMSTFQSSFCQYSDSIAKKIKKSVTDLIIKVDIHLLNAFHVTALSFIDSIRAEF